MKRMLLLYGEHSGEIYARDVASRYCGEYEIRGYQDYGFNTSDLAVMGVFAVLRRAFYFLKVKRTIERAIDEWKPDLVYTIDYPGMNLRLAAYAKARGIRTVHLVCPQVWAWKKGRIPKIEASLDKLLCFFPFEPALFKPGFAEFVGHPLKRMMDAEPRLPREKRLVAVLPGSRISEIERNLPLMLDAVKMLGNVKIEIPAASENTRRAIVEVLRANAFDEAVCKDGGARETLRRADVAAVASGTATLEAALAGTPTVLVYRVSALFAWLARRLVKGIRHVGLANIIWEKMRPGSNEFPMPELLQEDFTPEALSSILAKWLDDPAAHAQACSRLATACALLDMPPPPSASDHADGINAAALRQTLDPSQGKMI